MKSIMIILMLLTFGFTSSMVMAGADKASAAAAISAADDARKKAASVDGEWRDTGKLIKKAKQAASKGDFNKAVKLANKAQRQGKHGYEQAVAQKDLKMPSYLK